LNIRFSSAKSENNQAVGSVGLDADFLDFFDNGENANGKTTQIEGLIERLERGEFDLIAVGRALLADPAFLYKHIHKTRILYICK
jgi:2,4-dienoyl-CoA reductase-like NADH-dependent reductase (Old Yellow Enzyme family)